MFPHSITIYRYSNETYTKQTIDGVYWQENIGISPNGKGTEENKSVTVITSPETTKAFNDSWTIQPRDRIVKGIGQEIKSLKELSNSYTVTNIAINTAETNIDNIVITGA